MFKRSYADIETITTNKYPSTIKPKKPVLKPAAKPMKPAIKQTNKTDPGSINPFGPGKVFLDVNRVIASQYCTLRRQ